MVRKTASCSFRERPLGARYFTTVCFGVAPRFKELSQLQTQGFIGLKFILEPLIG